ncbi:hypothetical protein ACHHYP_16950 [Achlya hypogyna]|uniref:Uncharacterized protein n=1 Tax=Achlya hypogyna TaxID=1202772 RepID=A0A1V9ZE52_ACHHY|nr:hypothetical protein ACHHYP_16950 [Achlya hypogyna]
MVPCIIWASTRASFRARRRRVPLCLARRAARVDRFSTKCRCSSTAAATTSFRGTSRPCSHSSLLRATSSMEGRWNGELESIPSQDEGTQVCSCELTFREEGVWNLRQMRTSISGLTTTQHSWIKPAADGILKVETDDPSLRGTDITMQECGANILIITATSKRTGRPVMVETITSIDNTRRLRTRFDETGGFRFVYVMNERRVVDAVSGAMERYDPMY